MVLFKVQATIRHAGKSVKRNWRDSPQHPVIGDLSTAGVTVLSGTSGFLWPGLTGKPCSTVAMRQANTSIAARTLRLIGVAIRIGVGNRTRENEPVSVGIFNLEFSQSTWLIRGLVSDCDSRSGQFLEQLINWVGIDPYIEVPNVPTVLTLTARHMKLSTTTLNTRVGAFTLGLGFNQEVRSKAEYIAVVLQSLLDVCDEQQWNRSAHTRLLWDGSTGGL